MKKNQTNYVIIGDPENVELISAMLTLKDGTRIIRLFKVHHEDLNGHHSHSFEKLAVTIAYGGRNYEGVIRYGLVEKFTLDGKDIEPRLNRVLDDMISYRRCTSCIEGMTKFMCNVEKIPYNKYR